MGVFFPCFSRRVYETGLDVEARRRATEGWSREITRTDATGLRGMHKVSRESRATGLTGEVSADKGLLEKEETIEGMTRREASRKKYRQRRSGSRGHMLQGVQEKEGSELERW